MKTTIRILVYIIFCIHALTGFTIRSFRRPASRHREYSRLHVGGNPAVVTPTTTRRFISTTRQEQDNSTKESAEADISILSSNIEKFLHYTQTSIDNQSFLSFVITGPSKKSVKQANTSQNNDNYRGKVLRVSGRCIQLQKKKKVQQLLHVTFKYYLATDVVKNWPLDTATTELQAILNNAIMVSKDWQMADSNNDDESTASDLQTKEPWNMQSAVLETTNATYQLNLVTDTFRIQSKAKQSTTTDDQLPPPQPQPHNRIKPLFVPTHSSYLHALGLTTADGQPRPLQASKLKQCNKFVEIVQALIEKVVITQHHTIANTKTDTISILDMGCGRGYLTFALHAFLKKQYNETSLDVRSTGIDVRPKLILEINQIARALGPDFDGLTFGQGTIEDHLVMSTKTTSSTVVINESETTSRSLNVLIALHACDTATDDALWAGIQNQVDIMVVAPCCHRQLRPQIDRLVKQQPTHMLRDVLRHAIHRERWAESVTDSLRALLLEMAGYTVQVFEFIGGEHTHKNCMITAVRSTNRKGPSEKKVMEWKERLETLSSFHGVKQQKLASLMNVKLGSDDDGAGKGMALSASGMPQL